MPALQVARPSFAENRQAVWERSQKRGAEMQFSDLSIQTKAHYGNPTFTDTYSTATAAPRYFDTRFPTSTASTTIIAHSDDEAEVQANEQAACATAAANGIYVMDAPLGPSTHVAPAVRAMPRPGPLPTRLPLAP